MEPNDVDLRARLLLAIDEIVRERGIAFVSLREVARRAGVSHAAPAHHFRNKSGLLTAYAAEGFLALSRKFIDEMGRSTPRDGRGRVEALGRAYVQFAVANKEQFLLMYRTDQLEIDDPAFVAASETAFSMLGGAIMRCVADGQLAAEDAEGAVLAAWSVSHGLATLWLSGRMQGRVRNHDPEVLAAEVTRVFVRGVFRT